MLAELPAETRETPSAATPDQPASLREELSDAQVGDDLLTLATIGKEAIALLYERGLGRGATIGDLLQELNDLLDEVEELSQELSEELEEREA